MNMTIRATKSGKIHLSPEDNHTVCAKRPIKLNAPIDPEEAAKISAKMFCSRCFGTDHQKILDHLNSQQTPPEVVVKKSDGKIKKVEKTALEPSKGQEIPIKAEIAPPTANPEFLPINAAGMDRYQVIDEMVKRLWEFAENVNYSTTHYRYKAQFYAEAMAIVKEMFLTCNGNVINKVFKKLK